MSAKHIGKTLQTLRNKHNLTQKEMAEIAEIKVSHYVLIENGETYPSIFEVLFKVCEEFNLTLDYFITYPEGDIISHYELSISEEDDLIMIMSMYLKKLDLQNLKILYSIMMLLDNTSYKNSTL